MTDDGDWIVAIPLIIAAAASVATTAYGLSKGSPAPPPPQAAPPPPPPQPLPMDTPPPPVDTPATEDVATQRRKRALQFGTQETLLTSPLGSGTETMQAPRTRSLLGG